jgi:hypothetical protein
MVCSMAKQTKITLVDDVDGSTADATVTFELDGSSYEMDLSAANAGKLRATLEPWVEVARRTGGRRRRNAGATAP